MYISAVLLCPNICRDWRYLSSASSHPARRCIIACEQLTLHAIITLASKPTLPSWTCSADDHLSDAELVMSGNFDKRYVQLLPYTPSCFHYKRNLLTVIVVQLARTPASTSSTFSRFRAATTAVQTTCASWKATAASTTRPSSCYQRLEQRRVWHWKGSAALWRINAWC